MNYRIAKKILTCKSSLSNDYYSVSKAKKLMISVKKGYYVDTPQGNTYFIMR